jgi:hypothetical protein
VDGGQGISLPLHEHGSRRDAKERLVEFELFGKVCNYYTTAENHIEAAKHSPIGQRIYRYGRSTALEMVSIDIASGSTSGSKAQDWYFSGNPEATGPFDSIKSFNDSVQFLSVAHVPLEGRWDPYRHLIRDVGKVCYTHGDLNTENIMVHGPPGSLKVSAIIDWEMAGWYPEYWEYCKIHLTDPRAVGDWFEANWASTIMEAPYNSERTALLEHWYWRQP